MDIDLSLEDPTLMDMIAKKLQDPRRDGCLAVGFAGLSDDWDGWEAYY